MKSKLSYIIIASAGLLLILLLGRWFLKDYWHRDTLVLKPVSFHELPGWDNTNMGAQKSFAAFQTSCKVFLRYSAEQSVGSGYLPLTAEDWQPACREALKLSATNASQAKAFFQRWFTPLSFKRQEKPHKGLFTGYYMPILKGSLVKTPTYTVPLYGPPSDLVTINLEHFTPNLKGKKFIGRLDSNRMVPYYSRKQITQGAIKDKASVVVWIADPIDRVFLEIQGSGIIQLPDGQELYVGYAGENGLPYTAIAKVLIDKGIMTKDNASMQAIKRYLTDNPKEINPVLNENQSFVFFSVQNQKAALGTQGVPLTAGYSLAVDRQWIPLGSPLWLDTTIPNQHRDDGKPFHRLMIAQDTGGAIRGAIRGDVYWGSGDLATYLAGHMKNTGNYWLLLPKPAVARLLQQHLLFQQP